MKGQMEGQMDWLAVARSACYSATEMAGVLGISLRQLERAFGECCGWTPRQWLARVRLWSAVLPLIDAKWPKQFYSDFGFSSASAFLHAFKNYHRCTTRRYVMIHLHSETDGFRQLRTCKAIDGAFLNTRAIPQHFRALDALAQLPARSDLLTFYYVRSQCRLATPTVAQKHPASPRSIR